MTEAQKSIAIGMIKTMRDKEKGSTDYIKYADLPTVNVNHNEMKVIIGLLLDLGLIRYLPEKKSDFSIMLTRSGNKIKSFSWLYLFWKRYPMAEKITIVLISSALSLLIGLCLLQAKYQEVRQQESRQDLSLKVINDSLAKFRTELNGFRPDK